MSTKRVSDLGEHIRSMDCNSQLGYRRISALAEVAQFAMESPQAHRSLEIFAQVFSVIEDLAYQAMNDINSEAEQAGGFHFKDERQLARQRARHEFRQSQAALKGV